MSPLHYYFFSIFLFFSSCPLFFSTKKFYQLLIYYTILRICIEFFWLSFSMIYSFIFWPNRKEKEKIRFGSISSFFFGKKSIYTMLYVYFFLSKILVRERNTSFFITLSLFFFIFFFALKGSLVLWICLVGWRETLYRREIQRKVYWMDSERDKFSPTKRSRGHSKFSIQKGVGD